MTDDDLTSEEDVKVDTITPERMNALRGATVRFFDAARCPEHPTAAHTFSVYETVGHLTARCSECPYFLRQAFAP